VKLPGSSKEVVISSFNELPGQEGRYFDPEAQSSWAYDHVTQVRYAPNFAAVMQLPKNAIVEENKACPKFGLYD
jgi:hypothetical protein